MDQGTRLETNMMCANVVESPLAVAPMIATASCISNLRIPSFGIAYARMTIITDNYPRGATTPAGKVYFKFI